MFIKLLNIVLKYAIMKKTIFILILLGLVSLNCKKKMPKYYPPGPYIVPHTLLFLINRKGKQLPDSVLKYLKLSYFNKGKKYYVKDFLPAIKPLDNMGIMTTRDIGMLSSKGNRIKTYYLEYPDEDVDTVYVDYDYIP